MKKILLGILTFSFFMAAYAFTAVPNDSIERVDGKNVKWMTWEEAISLPQNGVVGVRKWTAKLLNNQWFRLI